MSDTMTLKQAQDLVDADDAARVARAQVDQAKRVEYARLGASQDLERAKLDFIEKRTTSNALKACVAALEKIQPRDGGVTAALARCCGSELASLQDKVATAAGKAHGRMLTAERELAAAEEKLAELVS